MKQKLSAKEYLYIASMLFGLFFGAGNLIFPVHMGQMAGANTWLAAAGFLVTGVGRNQPQRRSLRAFLKGRASVWACFHLPALSDYRSVFRDSALRYDLVHRRNVDLSA